jgi:hypothetical protein
MSLLVTLLLCLVYIALLATIGLMTLRRGHTLLFFLGLFVPLFWIAGAFMAPTSASRAASARSNLH